MDELAVDIRGLTKRYGGRKPHLAVNTLDLAVPRGSVVGLIGPNGAGKTTTIRSMLGLCSITHGTISLLGEPIPSRFAEVRQRVGAIVETPKFLPNVTARRNLQILAYAKGVGMNQVDEVIDRVGLTARAKSRFKSYSLGMKQRLAVASTLLGGPDLLILDEPANGLDPAGIASMRELIRSIADEGKTVIVSSHQLADIERICDRVAIMSEGRSIYQGPLEELTQATQQYRVVVGPDAVAVAMEALSRAGWAASRADESILVNNPPGGSAIAECLAAAGIYPEELVRSRHSLEDIFLQMTTPTAGGH